MTLTVVSDIPEAPAFEFHNAWWFRRPLRIVTVLVSAFALVALHRALLDAGDPDHNRAFAGLAVIVAFLLLSVWFSASINDGLVEIADGRLHVRFESYFNANFPVGDIAAVRRIDPKPKWRYSMGLSTDWTERISCSHGGDMVEIEFAHPHELRIWPRTIWVRRLWLAVMDADAFIAALSRSAQAPAAEAPRLSLAA